MNLILCPIWKGPFNIDLAVCTRGHKVPVIDGSILDLLPNIKKNKQFSGEEKHWNKIADKGRMKIMSDGYISRKIFLDCRNSFEIYPRGGPNLCNRNISISGLLCYTLLPVGYYLCSGSKCCLYNTVTAMPNHYNFQTPQFP
jgi:hypothetical protein